MQVGNRLRLRSRRADDLAYPHRHWREQNLSPRDSQKVPSAGNGLRQVGLAHYPTPGPSINAASPNFSSRRNAAAASLNSSMLIAGMDARVERMSRRSVGRIGGTCAT